MFVWEPTSSADDISTNMHSWNVNYTPYRHYKYKEYLEGIWLKEEVGQEMAWRGEVSHKVVEPDEMKKMIHTLTSLSSSNCHRAVEQDKKNNSTIFTIIQ